MGILDFLHKKKKVLPEPVKPKQILTSPKISAIRSDVLKNNVIKSEEHESKVEKSEPIKVTETNIINKNICILKNKQDAVLELYCPIRIAKIFGHSVLTDKLGELTKFIIISLYQGHTIEEMNQLTQMGERTIMEETEFLRHAGILKDDKRTLSKLGKEYGEMLTAFKNLSDGIDVCFNLFAEIFEPLGSDYLDNVDSENILSYTFIPELSQNDNFGNSLEIMQKMIVKDVPLSYEVKKSLYTRVMIEPSTKYKRVCIKDFEKTFITTEKNVINVAIPYERITISPRYTVLDQYRDIKDKIDVIKLSHKELLSEQANKIITMFDEEERSEMIILYINSISKSLDSNTTGLLEKYDSNNVFCSMESQPTIVTLTDTLKDIYLFEIERKHMFRIQKYPYNRMEEL